MVSEFADPNKIRCSACDVGMMKAGEAPFPPTATPTPTKSNKPDTPEPVSGAQKPEKQEDAPPSPAIAPRAGKPNKLKLASAHKPEPTSQDEPEGKIKSKKVLEPETERAPLELHPKQKKKKKKGVSHTIWAFLVFAVIGSASSYGYLQFRGTYLQPIIPYFWIGVLAMHILITLKALSNDMMQGILCVFVPGWSLVYLAICDNYYYKAIIFGLLMGIGFDGGSQLLGYIMNMLGAIQHFINTGGGETRRTSIELVQYFFYA
jgi:hypothetical protein